MLADWLEKAWRARRVSTAIDTVMRFSDEGLVLGAGTVLAKSGGARRDISVDPLEPRLQALLTAAHLRRPSVWDLAHLHKAAERWRDGDDALAIMHLVLSRLDRLEQPEVDARRLFLADELLKAGIEADAIIDVTESADPTSEPLHKYRPDQPRVPAGNGKPSGEWTTGDGSSGSSPSGSSASSEQLPTTQPAPERALAIASQMPWASQPQNEVNPDTITPVIDHPYTGDDACFVAQKDCFSYAVGQSHGNPANDNWEITEVFRCQAAATTCEYMGFLVENIPGFDRGGVIFPHGGVVIADKGKEYIYIPGAYRGGIPPFRRSL